MTRPVLPLSLAAGLALHVRRISATTRRWIACGAVAVLLPSAAQAACEQWDLSGRWTLSQSNGHFVTLNLQQAGNEISGNARYKAPGGFSGRDSLNGNINPSGVTFQFTVPWLSVPGNPLGYYTGIIHEDGRIEGSTIDKNHPGAEGASAHWNGNRAAKCKVAAAETSDEPTKKPKAPIPGAGDQVLDVPLEGGGGVASDAILQALKQPADLAMIGITGPRDLQAGLSATYTFTMRNNGDVGATVELNIIFAGKLDQTGQIVAGAGLACEVGQDAGINAALRCTGGQLGAGETATVVVQGRGQDAGAGMLVTTLNASRSVEESNYNNNIAQYNVTIN